MEYMYTIIEATATECSWLLLVKPLQRYANYSCLLSDYNQVLIRWTTEAGPKVVCNAQRRLLSRKGQVQCLHATDTITRVAGASSMRDTVQKIIGANHYGRALHAPSPKFRLLGTSPILRSAVCDKGHALYTSG